MDDTCWLESGWVITIPVVVMDVLASEGSLLGRTHRPFFRHLAVARPPNLTHHLMKPQTHHLRCNQLQNNWRMSLRASRATLCDEPASDILVFNILQHSRLDIDLVSR
jgi:hypothetical protein